MGLRKQKGNMYDFITHTFNTVKGFCYHDCSYCYMKSWGNLNPVRFDRSELKTDLGKGNFIFVGSSNDLFAEGIPNDWIADTIDHCETFDNRYLFQSKNPEGFWGWLFPEQSVLATTIETNRDNKISTAPTPQKRVAAFECIDRRTLQVMITIEPIMDFDLPEFVELIKSANPNWVNIGADSKGHKLPEPSSEKVSELIAALKEFTEVKIKKNLKRLHKN